MPSPLRMLAKTNTTPRPEGGEPVSPELALIDPELARIERARLAKTADSEWRVDLSASRIAGARSLLLLGALLVAMFAAGIFVSRVVTHEHASASVQVAAVTSAAHSDPNGASTASGSSGQAPAASAESNAELLILSLVLRSPKRNLPPQLVDSSTGLLKNNVHTRCHRSGRSRGFLCVIQPPARRAGEGLYVRYWPSRGRRGVFAWYGYREG
jgi:hypothetical protein